MVVQDRAYILDVISKKLPDRKTEDKGVSVKAVV